MRRVLTLAVLCVLAAGPASAYVQPGSVLGGVDLHAALPSGAAGGLDDAAGARTPVLMPDPGTEILPVIADPVATEPVPEPGTMVMASMGLMALGATLRRRRGR